PLLYTRSLHDALPICQAVVVGDVVIDPNKFLAPGRRRGDGLRDGGNRRAVRKSAVRSFSMGDEAKKRRANSSRHDGVAAGDLGASRTIRWLVNAESGEISAAF